MGNCMGGEDVKSYSTYYHDDLQLSDKSEIYKPLSTSLFNTLRKTSDSVIITHNKSTIEGDLLDIISFDFQTASPSNLKTLLNFKKIVYIGNNDAQAESYFKKIKTHVSFNKLYVVSEAFIKEYLKEYPIFMKENWKKLDMVTNKLPLLLIDSKEFVHNTDLRVKLFIHTVAKKDMTVYKMIGVNSDKMMINAPPQGTKEQTKVYYVNALMKIKEAIVVMLHHPSLTSSDILSIITTFLLEKYKIPVPYSQNYLKRHMPSTSSHQVQHIEQQIEKVAKTANIIESAPDKYAKLFQKLCTQSNDEKTERAYNLLSTLIINIYSNPNNEESYRQVKRTNRQLNDLLVKYKNGLKLLDELGFRQKDDHWVNTVESKYLKIYKTDFDLGYKRFKSQGVEKV